ncbi:MAG: hypothetical protein JSU07_03530 [Bacteroidetes bacterium]|nr:hypothetical protein [Bacteroidota bacterium]
MSFGIGRAKSVLFLSRNVKQNNDASGWYFCLTYGGNRLLRGSMEYSRYMPINIAPTWYNVNAYSAEVNIHALAKFNNSKVLFYPLLGVSYNDFKGYFTGKEDFQNLAARYKINTVIVSEWWGVNTGLGVEFYIKQFSLNFDYRMRSGLDNSTGKSSLNIMDICLTASLRYTLKVPTFYRLLKSTHKRYFIEGKDASD